MFLVIAMFLVVTKLPHRKSWIQSLIVASALTLSAHAQETISPDQFVVPEKP